MDDGKDRGLAGPQSARAPKPATAGPAVGGPLAEVTLIAADFAASLAFYDAIFGALAEPRRADYVDEEDYADDETTEPPIDAASWGSQGQVWLVTATPGATPTRGVHLSLRAPDRAAVDAFHAAALAHGGTSREAPRRWTLYRRGDYRAVVGDPQGNTLEAVGPE